MVNELRPSCLAVLLAALGLAAALPAQGIRWTDLPSPPPSRSPVLHLREYANGDWALCFDGWSTVGTGPLGGEEAAAVGTPYGSRTVRATESEFLRGGTGGETPAAPLFPFVSDPSVDAVFFTRAPTHTWYGFRATIAGPVPDHGMGSLTFRVPVEVPHSAAMALSTLGASQAGVALVDAQGNPIGGVFLVHPDPAVSDSARLASICYYKFDRGSGGVAVNYAGIEGGARGLATLSHPVGSPWAAAGRFDSGLRAGATCDTGFHGDLGGRFTVAWFMRQRTPPSPAAESPVFTLGSWRVFTGGNAGSGLRCVGWGGQPAGLGLPLDVQALAAVGWVHVALVVDSDSAQATWFVNGVSRHTVALHPVNGRVRIPDDPGTLLVGSTSSLSCPYDLDEFRLAAEAVRASTIASWAADSPAAAQPFTAACGANLRHQGEPLLGATVRYLIEATPGSIAGVFLNAAATPPLDLGFLDPGLAGCPWYSDLSTLLAVLPVPAGSLAVLPVAIPNLTQLRGLELYDQALVFTPGSGWRATNAHALSLR